MRQHRTFTRGEILETRTGTVELLFRELQPRLRQLGLLTRTRCHARDGRITDRRKRHTLEADVDAVAALRVAGVDAQRVVRLLHQRVVLAHQARDVVRVVDRGCLDLRLPGLLGLVISCQPFS